MTKLSWRGMSAQLTKLTETDIAAMLDEEIKQHKRVAVARRLHQRLCILRANRERADIMNRIAK